jgi:hypothetical protein
MWVWIWLSLSAFATTVVKVCFPSQWLKGVDHIKRAFHIFFPSQYAAFVRKPETPHISRKSSNRSGLQESTPDMLEANNMCDSGGSVPSPSLRNMPSIMSVLQATGAERATLLEKRKSHLRKSSKPTTSNENESPNVGVAGMV